MLADNEQALERLVTLLDERTDLDAASILELWRKERVKAHQEREEWFRKMADESIYTVARVELAKQRGVGDEVRDVLQVVERLRIKRADLPEFAKQNGLRLVDLLDVLELRRFEVTAKGKTWRSGSPLPYVDHAAQERARQAKVSEYEQDMRAAERRNERMKVPTSFKETVRNWTNR